jgi:hypothetical protein
MRGTSDLLLQDEDTDPVPAVQDPAPAAAFEPDPDGTPIGRHHVQPAPSNDSALADKAYVATYQELHQQRCAEDLDPAKQRNMVLPRIVSVISGGSTFTRCLTCLHCGTSRLRAAALKYRSACSSRFRLNCPGGPVQNTRQPSLQAAQPSAGAPGASWRHYRRVRQRTAGFVIDRVDHVNQHHQRIIHGPLLVI